MRTRYIIPFIILSCFLLPACQKSLSNGDVDFTVTVQKTAQALGDTAVFSFTGNPDVITFYSGEVGKRYQYRNRTAAVGTPILSFGTKRENGTQANSLSVLISSDFAGAAGADTATTLSNLSKGTWTDLTSRTTLSTGAYIVSNIDLSDVATQGKPIYLAFKYNGYAGSIQNKWTISNFSITNNLSDATSYTIANFNNGGSVYTNYGVSTYSPGFVATRVLNNYYWVVGTGTLVITGATSAASAAPAEAWTIVGPIDLRKVTPDLGVVVKTVSQSSGGLTYLYKYPTTGSYNATFTGGRISISDSQYVAILLLLLSGSTALHAQTAFTAGNIIVSRIGSTADGVFSATNKVYLDEYTPSGALVRTITMPTTSGSALMESSSNDEGYLIRSVDGHYLTITGYSKTASSGVGGSTAVATPRAIGLVKYDGTVTVLVPPVTAPVATTGGTVVTGTPTTLTVNSATGIAVGQYVYGSYVPNGATVAAVSGTTVTLSGSGGTNGGSTFIFMAAATPAYANLKSPGTAITTNGTDFWLCSRETSLQYYNSTTNTLIGIAAGSTGTTARSLQIADGQLYSSNDFGLKLATVGTGTPVTSTATAALSYASGTFAPQSAAGFCMLDASSTESGSDVMYAVETATGGTGYGIVKYCKVSGHWTVKGGYGAYTDVYQGLTAVLSGSTVTLYAIRGVQGSTNAASGTLVKIVDATGYNATMSGTETILATSATASGGAWRGVAIAPDNSIALPLNLLSFTGTASGNNALLNWVTVNEINVAGFGVEKSSDAASFTSIGYVQAYNSTGNNNYAFTDRNITSQTAYYRLKMADKDGSYRYSNVVTVNSKGIIALEVYPNPVSQSLYVKHTTLNSKAVFTVYDMQGRLVKQQAATTGAEQSTIPVAELINGEYILALTTETGISKITFIKY
ncbi:hypothetical protein F5148DRAFT_1295811 [Russula earlei]|uniref:Uncharacterized protein n=1 Tax=Russula earlei TaxID=71964 RepID=A0ACC0TS71_9AGAM|nr:hypothetical protein F5148DRAFT_1295811 [Russula earlei]